MDINLSPKGVVTFNIFSDTINIELLHQQKVKHFKVSQLIHLARPLVSLLALESSALGVPINLQIHLFAN